MKLIIPAAVGAAIAILAITVAKRREPVPLPDRPEGDWETDRNGIDS
jgi:hypothetical protein